MKTKRSGRRGSAPPQFNIDLCSACGCWIAVPPPDEGDDTAEDKKVLDLTMAAMALEDHYKIPPKVADDVAALQSETSTMCCYCAFLHGLDAWQEVLSKSAAAQA